MQTHGYEHSAAWKQALALLDKTVALARAFEDDAVGIGDRLRALAVELPLSAATVFEQLDYDNARAHADASSQHLFRLRVQAQTAEHLGLMTPRQLKDLLKQIDTLDDRLTAMPDELFEDDGQQELSDAA